MRVSQVRGRQAGTKDGAGVARPYDRTSMSILDPALVAPEPDAIYEAFIGVGGGPGSHAVSGAGRRADRARLRLERDLGDPDRIRQEPGGDRTRVRDLGPRRTHLLHRADQGPGQREVLRRCRDLRLGAGRHDDGRRLGERRCGDHLLHGGGAGKSGAAAGLGQRDRECRDGRVPLLRRPGPRLGLAGAAAGASRRTVPADVGDARRRHAGSSGT